MLCPMGRHSTGRSGSHNIGTPICAVTLTPILSERRDAASCWEKDLRLGDRIDMYRPEESRAGEKTTELTRTRGWTHWHRSDPTPRQLLLHGLLAREGSRLFGFGPTSELLGCWR